MNETVFKNVHVTGGGEAALIRGDEFAAVGSLAQCLALADHETEVIDCRGLTMVPGIIESHCHLVEAGDELIRRDSESDDLSYACRNDQGDGSPCVAMGVGDDHFNALRAQGIQGVSDHGLVVFHSSGHIALADGPASAILGRSTDGSGPVVIHEPYEDPAILVLLQARKHRARYLAAAVSTALETYAAHGITTLHDNTWDSEILRFLADHVRGMDILSWAKGTDGRSALHLAEGIRMPDNVNYGPIKFFVDGAFFNKTAWLFDPYPGERGWCGRGMAAEAIASQIEPFVARDRQCVFHAAGDRAISELLDAVEILQPLYPRITQLRLRIEHAQLIAAKDYPRIRDLGMVVSVQPAAAADPDRDIRILGEERAARAYPHARILAEGIPMAMGSDFPYESTMDPFRSMRWACSRRLGPSLTPDQALTACTFGGAYAGFAEHRVGRIEAGYQADFFLTEENPLKSFTRGAEAVAATYSRGIRIYERNRN